MKIESSSLLTGRRTVQILLISAILLPIGMVFLFVSGRLFHWLGNTFSANIFDGVALGLGFFWFLTLVALLLSVALRTQADEN